VSLFVVPTQFGAVESTRTLAGDVVTTRHARFRTQEDQILFLRELVDTYRGHAGIRARARDIVFREYHCEPRNEIQYALAIGNWVQANITYVRELPEEFSTPVHTLLTRFGDCDDFACTTGTLCESIGIESELVGMAWETPTGPGGKMVMGFGHIFARAIVHGVRVPLDATLEFPIEDMTDPIAVGRERGLPGLKILVA
jgi:transglutaminase-like putative cysteine protease